MNRLKKILKSRSAAAVSLVISILLSIILGTGRSVSKLEKKAYNAYFDDDIRYGEVYADMKKFGQYASMLNSIAESCGADTSGLGSASGRFSGHFAEPYISSDDFDSLFTAAAAAYNVIIAGRAEEQQKISAKQYFYEMDSTRERLENNKYYNSLAEDYNKAISSFPASLILKNAEKMIVFD